MKVYVDMDGVLADFFGEFPKLYGFDNYNDMSDKDIVAGLENLKFHPNFWNNLPVLPNAMLLLQVIKEKFGTYTVLSSPLSHDPHCKPGKLEWVMTALPKAYQPEDIILRHEKYLYAKNDTGNANILIDDYGVNVRKWEQYGGIGLKHKDHKLYRTLNNILKL